MKKVILFAIVSIIIFGTQLTAFTQPVATAPVYRFCSKKKYCIWIQSTDGVAPSLKGVSNGPWKNDGIVFYALKEPTRKLQTAAMYQVERSDDKGIRYFMSTNYSEIDAALKSGYIQKTTAFYVAAQPMFGAVPIYRLYSLPSTPPGKPSVFDKLMNRDVGAFGQANGPVDDGHFYTIDEAERDKQIAAGYKDEGIAGYAWASPAKSSVASADPTKMPDLRVGNVRIDGNKVVFLVSNTGQSSVESVDVLVKISDADGNLIKQEKQTFGGISQNSKREFSVASTISLANRGITVVVDPNNKVEEDNEKNNSGGFSPLKGPSANTPSQIENLKNYGINVTNIVTRNNRTTISVDVVNPELFPAVYFENISSLPPNPCSQREPHTRLIAWAEVLSGGKWINEGCKALTEQNSLRGITFGIDTAPSFEKIRISVFDRKENVRYVSNEYSTIVFEADKVLTGCKHFLGRVNGEYLCTSTKAFENCEAYKKTGKPVVCKVTSK